MVLKGGPRPGLGGGGGPVGGSAFALYQKIFKLSSLVSMVWDGM